MFKEKEYGGHYEIKIVNISCLQVQIQGSTRFRSKKVWKFGDWLA